MANQTDLFQRFCPLSGFSSGGSYGSYAGRKLGCFTLFQIASRKRRGRLAFKPEQKVRAILILRMEDAGSARAQRLSGNARQAKIKTIQQAAEHALGDIDTILQRFSGKCLTERPNALGSIAVETTSAGIRALAGSEHIKAILEDQPVFLAR